MEMHAHANAWYGDILVTRASILKNLPYLLPIQMTPMLQTHTLQAYLRRIKAPPPSPLDMGFMMPWQSAVATVASTALPPLWRILRPMSEQRP